MEREIVFIEYGQWEPSGAAHADLPLNEKLRRLRLEAGLSLATVAKSGRLSKSELWQLETELDKMPSAAILYRLSVVYKVQMECFFKHSITCNECISEIKKGAWSWTVEYSDGDTRHFHSECLDAETCRLMQFLATH